MFAADQEDNGGGGYSRAHAARVMRSNYEKNKKASRTSREAIELINYCGIIFSKYSSSLFSRILCPFDFFISPHIDTNFDTNIWKIVIFSHNMVLCVTLFVIMID